LEEAKILYLTREQLKLCEVRIDRATGQLLWCVDDEPVTLPLPTGAPQSTRSHDVTALIDGRLTTTRRREGLLRAARARVEEAMAHGVAPTATALEAIATPLVQEGLLRVRTAPFPYTYP
jgi:hypothetical protein